MANAQEFLREYTTSYEPDNQLRLQSPGFRFRVAAEAISDLITYVAMGSRVISLPDVNVELSYLSDFGHPLQTLEALDVTLIKDSQRIALGKVAENAKADLRFGLFYPPKQIILFGASIATTFEVADQSNFEDPSGMSLANPTFKAALIAVRSSHLAVFKKNEQAV